MDEVKKYLNNIEPIEQDDWEFIKTRLESSVYKKSEKILLAGSVENHIYYIEKGLIRYYLPNEKNDITFGFCFQNDLASAYDSFLNEQPSSYQIEALTPTKLWRISKVHLQELYTQTKVGSTIGRIIGERLFVKSIQRELSLLNETAEQRYLNLFTERPNLIKEIPLKYVASYIGITPQALSRIRNRIS